MCLCFVYNSKAVTLYNSFFLLLPSDNDVAPRQNREAGWGGVGGAVKSSAFSCFPTDTCSLPWLGCFVWFLTVPACDLQNFLCAPQLSPALSALSVNLH